VPVLVQSGSPLGTARAPATAEYSISVRVVFASMRRAAALIVLLICCFPAAALARRLVRGNEKAEIVAALRRAHDIGPLQKASCMRVYVSTVNEQWATMQFIFVARCERQDADGVSVIHRSRGRWRYVTAGSAFTCPIPGHIPRRVQTDLRLSCISQ
jgi:hypothetical protein